ncbi:MAG TPA: hypothetical protein VG105_10035 [Paraburkholderia sp.]|jgi:methionine-rich copper-binding protein CopC|nr:hypothetical protein [Paraburkholderia sp.]
MKLSDLSRPALRASAVSAAAPAVASTAYAHARPTSLEPVPNAGVATDGHRTQGTYAFNVK